MFINSKWLTQILGLLFFGTLFALAWVFFKERMLTFDPAYFSFRIIQEHKYDIELGRWGSVVSQIIPLWLYEHGCSLKAFLQAYSVSFIIIYYIIFLAITLLLKNERIGIAMMISLCLTFRHSFYYSTAELYQAIAISMLIWALLVKLNDEVSKTIKYVCFGVALILVYVTSYYHQLSLFALLFIGLFEILNKKRYKDFWLIGFVLFTLAWYYIRIKVLTTTTYESGKIPTFDVFREQLPRLLSLPSFHYLKHFANRNLWEFVAVMALCSYFIVRQKKWLLGLFVFNFIGGFIILDCITYYKGESPIMYENYLTLLGLFAAVTLCGIYEKIISNTWTIVLTTITLAWNLNIIYGCREPFSQHIAYLQRLTNEAHKHNDKKYLIAQVNFPWGYAWSDWALPFETLLYSSIQGPDSSISVMCAENISQYDSLVNMENVFLGPRWAVTWFWSNSLNQNYFRIPPTPYKKLATSQADSIFNEAIFTKDNIKIIPQSEVFVASKSVNIVVPITIINKSGQLLRSIPDTSSNSVKLSFHICSPNGKRLGWGGNRNTLEYDIADTVQYDLVLNQALKRGEYLVDIDFVTENKRWWEINSRFKLVVE